MIFNTKTRRKERLEDNIIKVILEVQHELHIAETNEQITFRKNQLRQLIESTKRYYGAGVISKAKNLIEDIR